MVRVKHRYFVVKINVQGRSENFRLSLKPFALYESVLAKVQQLHGDFGVGSIMTGFTTKYCNEITRIAMLKVRHESHKILASSIPAVQTIDGKNVTLKIIYVGATMKQCFKFIKRHQILHLLDKWSTLKTDEERKAFKDGLMDFTLADKNNITMR